MKPMDYGVMAWWPGPERFEWLNTTYIPIRNTSRALLCPVVSVEGERLTLQAHLAAPVATSLLKNPVMNLQSQASDVAAALDAVISGV